MPYKQRYMKVAIDLARQTMGQTSPNPSVGAVIVKEGKLIGTGVHVKAGEPHAEIHALRQAGPEAEGADMFVTLEPCSHYGKTPPCSKAIIESKIKKVYIATPDPNPKVSGRGIKWLKQEGIEVEVGICEEEALKLNEHFFHFMKTNRPYVTLKAAVSMDGKMATYTGDSKWITSEEARLDVHNLRHRHDAILVGVETIIHDNPHLTTRLPHGGINPTRIVLDTHLRIPLQSNVINDKSTKTIVVCGQHADSEKESLLRKNRAEVLRLNSEQIDLPELMKELGKRKILSVFVEGGSRVHTSFIESGFVNQVIMYMAPKLVGGEKARLFFSGKGSEKIGDSIELEFQEVEQIGPDLKIIAKPRIQEVK